MKNEIFQKNMKLKPLVFEFSDDLKRVGYSSLFYGQYRIRMKNEKWLAQFRYKYGPDISYKELLDSKEDAIEWCQKDYEKDINTLFEN